MAFCNAVACALILSVAVVVEIIKLVVVAKISFDVLKQKPPIQEGRHKTPVLIVVVIYYFPIGKLCPVEVENENVCVATFDKSST